MRFARACFAALLTIAGVPLAHAGAIPTGLGRADVTPDGPIRLNGYSSRGTESRGVQGKLWAKAIAFGADGDGPAVLVTVDTLGIPEAITAEVAARLKAKAGIARENLAISASHTHSGPVVSGCAVNIFGKPLEGPEKEHVERYTKSLMDGIEAAALAALADRKPAILSRGRGSASFAVNRRTIKDGRWAAFGEVPDGPVDRSLPVLRIADEAGHLRGVLTLYACHCTTLKPEDNAVHGDWAVLSQDLIEAAHPGAQAMTLIGCGADANPRARSGGMDVARVHARELADEVERLLRTPLAPVLAPPRGAIARVSLPFDVVPTRAALEVQAKAPAHAGANARLQLAKLDALGAIPPALDYPIQAWRFGDDLVILFLAGEVVVDYALALKAEFDPDRLWVAAYSNDAPCYIPSDRILVEGGYEAEGAMLYYGWPSRLKPGVQAIILDAAKGLIPREFRAK